MTNRDASTLVRPYELERDAAWTIPLARNVAAAAAVDCGPVTGFIPIDSVWVYVEVDLDFGPRDATLTVNVEQSVNPGGPFVASLSFDFKATDLTGGGGTARGFISQPPDVLKVTAFASPKSRWLLRNVTVIPAWADSAGPGAPAVGIDPLWDAKGDLAVGTGPDTAIRLPVGLVSQMLVVDLTTPSGLRWVNQPTGVGGDGSLTASPYWRITSNGHFEWAPGNSVWDSFLYRAGVNNLVTPGALSAAVFYAARPPGDTYGVAIAAAMQGDTQHTWYVTGNGWMWFGPGGDAPLDIALYRSGSGILRTDASLRLGGDLVARLGGVNTQVNIGNDGFDRGSIRFGSAVDTNLYRKSPANLQTDGSFWVGEGLAVGNGLYLGFAIDTVLNRGGPGVIQANGSFQAASHLIANNGSLNQIALWSDGKIYFGNAFDTVLYRESASWLAAQNLHLTGTGLKFPDGTLQTTAALFGVSVLARKTTSKIVSNDLAEIDLLNGEFTVPAGAMGTGRVLKLTVWGDWYWYDGTSTTNQTGMPQWRVKLGGTTVFDLGNGYSADRGENLVLRSRNRRYTWGFTVLIGNISATTQVCKLEGVWINTQDNNGGWSADFYEGNGRINGIPTGSLWGSPHNFLGHTTATINTAVALPLQFTAPLQFVGGQEIKLLGATLELI